MYGSPSDVADLISQRVRGLYGGGGGNAVGGEWEDLGLECSEAKAEKSSFREKVWTPARAVVSYFFRTPSTIVEAKPLSMEADPALEDSYNEWTVRVRCNPYSTIALSYPNSSSSLFSFSSPSSPSPVIMSNVLAKAGSKVVGNKVKKQAEKQAERLKFNDPYYEYTINDRGKTVRKLVSPPSKFMQ